MQISPGWLQMVGSIIFLIVLVAGAVGFVMNKGGWQSKMVLVTIVVIAFFGLWNVNGRPNLPNPFEGLHGLRFAADVPLMGPTP